MTEEDEAKEKGKEILPNVESPLWKFGGTNELKKAKTESAFFLSKWKETNELLQKFVRYYDQTQKRVKELGIEKDKILSEYYEMYKEANAEFLKQFKSLIILGIQKKNASQKGGASIKAKAELKKAKVRELIESGSVSLPIKKANLVHTFSKLGLTPKDGYSESFLYDAVTDRKRKNVKAKPPTKKG